MLIYVNTAAGRRVVMGPRATARTRVRAASRKSQRSTACGLVTATWTGMTLRNWSARCSAG